MTDHEQEMFRQYETMNAAMIALHDYLNAEKIEVSVRIHVLSGDLQEVLNTTRKINYD